MAVEISTMERICRRSKAAAAQLRRMTPGAKSAAIELMADALVRRTDEILRENEQDVADARAARRPPAMVERLFLDPDRIMEMARGMRQVAALPDPVGEVESGWRLPNGLEVARHKVPLGVVAVIYEGRPNVTSDIAALCLKSGNAAILRGSTVAERSNRAIAEALAGALADAGVPDDAMILLGTDREELRRLIQMEGLVDLVIPRGGEELKKFLLEHARVPVIYAASGNNHVFVDADADVEMAIRIAVNAKVQRPGVCNAAETLLVHRAAAPEVVPAAVEALTANGVELRICPVTRELLGERAQGMAEATDEDYATEFLDLVMAVRVVDSLEEAIDHVERYGSGHSEAIVTRSLHSAREFQVGVDAACVYVNASTRFTDGGQFGMGAEIGNSTQKLHARGPVGLRELTTVKYLVTGDGQVRT